MGLSTEISTLRPLTSTNKRRVAAFERSCMSWPIMARRQAGVAGRWRHGKSSASSWRALACTTSSRPARLVASRKAAGGVERGARASRDARIGEMHADARQQFVHDQRLGDVVHAAGGQAFEHVLGLGEAGHEDDGQSAEHLVALHAPAGFEAVEAGHDGIHEHAGPA